MLHLMVLEYNEKNRTVEPIKMSKATKYIVAFSCTFLFFVLVLSPFFSQKLTRGTVCIHTHCFEVQVAKTFWQKEKGLMFRESLEKNEGMLFVFEKEGNYPFWMKNTLIPLDMIWINQKKEIVFIKENALPCKNLFAFEKREDENNCPVIDPNTNAKYVLEINGGASEEMGFILGNKVIIED